MTANALDGGGAIRDPLETGVRVGLRLPDSGESASFPRNLAGIAWIMVTALAVLAPALHHGLSLGAYDVLARYGLTSSPGTVIHYPGAADQADAIIPWASLSWTQVHNLQLPLWNPYNGMGLPLAFNWQSSAFSLPSLIGYLVPASYAYTIQVIVTLWIAGVGAFVFGRVLGLSVLPATFAGTVFELSGSFVGWLGWPHSSVISWMGWLFAAVLLIVRGRRLLGITMFAASMGFAILAGQPEILTMLIMSLAVFVGFVLLGMLGTEPICRSPIRVIGDLLLAGIAGLALGSPVALPGLQLAASSARSSTKWSSALPGADLIHVIAQGFNGLPVSGSTMFGDPYYIESAAYVGVIAVVLAFVAVAIRRRDAAVLGMVAIVVVSAVAAFLPIGARALAGNSSARNHRLAQSPPAVGLLHSDARCGGSSDSDEWPDGCTDARLDRRRIRHRGLWARNTVPIWESRAIAEGLEHSGAQS